MAETRTSCLLRLTLAVLIAVSTAQKAQEKWKVAVGGESDLQDNSQLSLDGLSGENPEGYDVPAGAPVLSRRKRSICRGRYNFNTAQKEEALRIHNELRAREGASNMMNMKWNDNLARRAHEWASKCKWEHGMLTNCDGSPIGQNLYMAMNGRYYPAVNVTTVIANGWWGEKKYYNYNTLHCVKGQQCGHYTQVVWAQSMEVGCTIVRCPKMKVANSRPWIKTIYFACDYAPTGNYVGEKPFKRGRACSRCRGVVEKGYYCQEKLCYECSHQSYRGCKCPNHNCVRGRYNRRKCRCICPRGYWGVRCDKTCTCKDRYWNCGDYRRHCHHIRYFNSLRKNCAGTCPNTCERPPRGVCRR